MSLSKPGVASLPPASMIRVEAPAKARISALLPTALNTPFSTATASRPGPCRIGRKDVGVDDDQRRCGAGRAANQGQRQKGMTSEVHIGPPNASGLDDRPGAGGSPDRAPKTDEITRNREVTTAAQNGARGQRRGLHLDRAASDFVVSPTRLQVAGFVVDFTQEALLDDAGRPSELRPQAFQVLRHLALNVGRLVTKDELMAASGRAPSSPTTHSFRRSATCAAPSATPAIAW
jgi:hypothetical protein